VTAREAPYPLADRKFSIGSGGNDHLSPGYGSRDAVFERDMQYNFGQTWLIILDALFVRRPMQRQSREALFRAKHILEKSLKDFGNSRMGGSLAARIGHKSNLLNSFFFHPIRHHS
jgi:hypothetical protein